MPESVDFGQFVPPPSQLSSDGLLKFRTAARPPAHAKSTSSTPLLNNTNVLSSNSHLQQPSSTSPRLHAGALGATRAGALDRADSLYGHHRQTSIVHGYQHSRNGSVASTSSSPLSPQIIAAAGGNSGGLLESESSMAENPAFSASTATLVPERSTDNNAQKRVERMHSGKSRREHSRHHSHSHSHSRHHHKDEHKTVGEYALHVLFTSVSRSQ